MASSSGVDGGGIPLHEFRKDVPPGWAPGLPDYPLRLFFERLKLWYRIFDGDDTLVGPLVAGRLQGKAQSLGVVGQPGSLGLLGTGHTGVRANIQV